MTGPDSNLRDVAVFSFLTGVSALASVALFVGGRLSTGLTMLVLAGALAYITLLHYYTAQGGSGRPRPESGTGGD
jgi:hypothetical protein